MFLLIVTSSLIMNVLADNKVVPQLAEKPNWLRMHCEYQQPNRNNCFRDVLEDIFPTITKGIPELKIEPFEPLIIKEIKVNRNAGEVITLNGSFDNVRIRGPSNATIQSASLDFNKNEMSFSLSIPKLRLIASYNLKGNILLLPLLGTGGVQILLKNIKTTVSTKISVKKMPKEAINIESMKVKFDIGAMRIHLDNLFNGNKVLAASFLMFLNQNSKEILAELTPDLEYGVADIFIDIWNSVFNKLALEYWIK